MVRKAKFNYMNILLILVFGLGLGILLYPNISNYLNEKNSSKAMSEYDETVAEMNEQQKKEIISSAVSYNERIMADPIGRFSDMTEAQAAAYQAELNVDGKGMMCYLKIDKLGVNLPVYHGTAEEVLQRYVGHVEGTSLPVGGLGTHCALSGHRGLPSAVLFTNLDRMELGDTFSILVLGEEHIYVVDQIVEVLPDDMSELEIDPEKDYCTLITCTPYGVNTHRLLVRGVRVPDEQVEEVLENAEANKKKWYDLTREQIVNIIAIGLTGIFGFVVLPILLFPPLPKSVVYLRPWDDNIEEVINSAIKVSEKATRANYAMDDIARESDYLARLRRWDDSMTYKEALSENDYLRTWNDYEYQESDAALSEEEKKNHKAWDNDILEKVDQDWAPISRDYFKRHRNYSEIKDVVERGSAEEVARDLNPEFEKELAIGKSIIKRGKELSNRLLHH